MARSIRDLTPELYALDVLQKLDLGAFGNYPGTRWRAEFDIAFWFQIDSHLLVVDSVNQKSFLLRTKRSLFY